MGSGHTAFDRRRDAPAPTPGAGPAARRLPTLSLDLDKLRVPALAAAGVVALVGMPALGYAIGHRDEPAGPATVGSPSVQIRYVAPWKPSGATIAGLGIDGAVGLRRPDGTVLAAGRLRDPAGGFDPAPAGLRVTAARSLEPTHVRLGDRDAIRYSAPLRAGGSLWMIAFPDAKGWMTVACRASAGRPDDACATVAATLRAPGDVKPVALGPDKRVSEALDRTTRAINRVRLAAKPGVSATSVPTRGRALGALAAADENAANALAKLNLRPQEPALFRSLVRSLRSEAAVLRRLSRAAKRRRRGTFDDARADLRTAQRRVGAAERDLRAAGYTGG